METLKKTTIGYKNARVELSKTKSGRYYISNGCEPLGFADTYYFEDPDNMSNEDKVFKSLDIELDSSFGDRNGNPDDVESWVEAWKENIRNEGGIGIKSKKTRQPAAPVPAEEALKIIEKNPARLKNLIKRAKKFYSGGTIAGGFDDWGGRAIEEDSAPRVLTGDTRIRVRK